MGSPGLAPRSARVSAASPLSGSRTPPSSTRVTRRPRDPAPGRLRRRAAAPPALPSPSPGVGGGESSVRGRLFKPPPHLRRENKRDSNRGPQLHTKPLTETRRLHAPLPSLPVLRGQRAPLPRPLPRGSPAEGQSQVPGETPRTRAPPALSRPLCHWETLTSDERALPPARRGQQLGNTRTGPGRAGTSREGRAGSRREAEP